MIIYYKNCVSKNYVSMKNDPINIINCRKTWWDNLDCNLKEATCSNKPLIPGIRPKNHTVYRLKHQANPPIIIQPNILIKTFQFCFDLIEISPVSITVCMRLNLTLNMAWINIS